jgi:hypothetical protein
MCELSAIVASFLTIYQNPEAFAREKWRIFGKNRAKAEIRTQQSKSGDKGITGRKRR